MMTCLVVAPINVSAQVVDFDMASVEAMIGNHKKVAAPLLTRSVNEVLFVEPTHRNYDKAVTENKKSEKNLKKWSQCMDYISLTLNAADGVTNTIFTVSDIRVMLKKYNKLYKSFYKYLIAQGNIIPADTQVIALSIKTYQDLAKECHHFAGIMGQILQVAGIVGGVTEYTTAQISAILADYSESCHNIRSIIEQGYSNLYWYYLFRTGAYWNKIFDFPPRPMGDILSGAIAKWKENAIKVMNRTVAVSGTNASAPKETSFQKKIDAAHEEVRKL